MTTVFAAHRNLPPPVQDVQNWEEAGIQLESAIVTFLHLSRKLEQSVTTHSIGIENLPLRLNRRTEHFHTLLTQPLAESFACVARTRNTLSTPIYRLPSEILRRIFEFATTGPTSNSRFESVIPTNCLCLYHIISVCSVWRKVGIAHAPLWRLVPLVCFKVRPRVISESSAKYSLERAGCSDLRLVALIGKYSVHQSTSCWEILADNAHRFWSVDILSLDLYSLEHVLDPILANAPPGSITELTFSCDFPARGSGNPGAPYVFQPETQLSWRQPAFESMLESLRVLRLEEVIPRMGNVSLSNLVELRMDCVNFGPESELREFLWTLSTASRLETLDIHLLFAYEEASQTLNHNRSFSLPSLRTLCLRYLSCNVIRTVLSTIRPGKYRIVLSLCNWSLKTRLKHDQSDTDIEVLKAAISSHAPDTLEITTLWLGYNSDDKLRSILMTQPNLTTIYVQDPEVYSTFFEALTRPRLPPHHPNRFARLRRIYMTGHTLKDIPEHEVFKKMLSSHPLEELVLRRSRNKDDSEEFAELEYWDDEDEDSDPSAYVKTMELQSWLEENIPRLRLLESGESCAFESSAEWLLW